MTAKHALPIVYSCSGCSNAAQAANSLAVRLDREGLAEMSCIVGVAAGVSSHVRLARGGRPLLLIDGCPIACCARALGIHEIQPTLHIDLSKNGIPKQKHEDLDEEELNRLWEDVVLPAVRFLHADPSEQPTPPPKTTAHPAKGE